MSYLRDACLLEEWIHKHGHPDFYAAMPRGVNHHSFQILNNLI
jgi:hypothetical protein